MDNGIRLTGMAWYAAEDFEQAKAVMKDGHTLHRTHAEWEAAATNGERNLSRQGMKVVRAYIKPSEFIEWCRAHGHDVDSKGRTAFANWAAKEAHGRGEV